VKVRFRLFAYFFKIKSPGRSGRVDLDPAALCEQRA